MGAGSSCTNPSSQVSQMTQMATQAFLGGGEQQQQQQQPQQPQQMQQPGPQGQYQQPPPGYGQQQQQRPPMQMQQQRPPQQMQQQQPRYNPRMMPQPMPQQYRPPPNYGVPPPNYQFNSQAQHAQTQGPPGYSGPAPQYQHQQYSQPPAGYRLPGVKTNPYGAIATDDFGCPAGDGAGWSAGPTYAPQIAALNQGQDGMQYVTVSRVSSAPPEDDGPQGEGIEREEEDACAIETASKAAIHTTEFDETENGIRQTVNRNKPELQRMWRQLDYNGNGLVSLAEIDKWIVN
ncbi:hypothetical protein KIPB_004862, partial [Kipferlia bialata]|eukprot:g4862.t1